MARGRAVRWSAAALVVLLIGFLLGLRSWEAGVAFAGTILVVLGLVANSAAYANDGRSG